MSLDVYLEGPKELVRCDHCDGRGKVEQKEEHFSANITHNLGRMADKAGKLYHALWRPEDLGATKAKDLIPYLKDGLERLKANPEHFIPLNPPNGWGTYEGLVNFTAKYLAACEEHPEAEIYVSR